MGEIKKIFSYAKDFKNKTYLATALATISAMIGMIPFVLVYFIIIEFTANHHPSVNYVLIMSGFILLGLILKSALFSKAMAFSHEAAFDTLMGMRHELADKMIRMPMGEINKKTSGKYKNIFVDYIDDMEHILAHMIPEGIADTVTPIIVIILLFVVDFRMALLALINVPIGVIIFKLMMRDSEEKSKHYFESAANLNSNIVEYIGGMEVIKIFNQTTSSFEKYTKSAKEYKKFTLAWYKDSWTYMAAFFTIVPATIIFVLPFGAMLYLNGSLSLEAYILSMLLSIGLGAPIVRLVEFAESFNMVVQKSKILDEVFNGVELMDKGKNSMPQKHDISFEKVSFAYEKKDVLKDISFKAKENNVTALVGASGSGKSTIAKLIVRFWDIKRGKIKIGDIDILDMSFKDLMNHISYVSQDVYLFNTSIMENIRMGKPDASDEEVIKMAKIAQCHDFIMQTENGYDTNIGDAGNKLSGGQKQRLSIARALLKDAPIIILDEATAFTDPENEDKIQEALNGLIGGKTLIVIAHRLSTIVHAENIIVMDEGKISAKGTHDELLKKSKLYQSMWKAHTEANDWEIKAKEANI
ncbi:ABC transporter ATP-binding protein [Crassaminicella profunda]|uniref:ABC transporter ATP-binding protein n=1 Tax=Crassaminicella profunda TaxID=1286698 RepID=UPI001CA68F08|nr:ABC transporter ATP-binding protein [Crassaminicella profunda]QZY55925.1 ABC transporter ATP-binding protein/permease [Crassaminicella profunda]